MKNVGLEIIDTTPQVVGQRIHSSYVSHDIYDFLQRTFIKDVETFVHSDLRVEESRNMMRCGRNRTYLSKLDVVLVELFFHDLFEYPQHEDLRFSQGYLLWVCKDDALSSNITRRRTECHLSWSSLWAASEPEPIALAS